VETISAAAAATPQRYSYVTTNYSNNIISGNITIQMVYVYAS